jgi:hypothetical protein
MTKIARLRHGQKTKHLRPATELVSTLSAEQAHSVGSLLKDGMPTAHALSSTVTVAEFIKRGDAAQQAIDPIIAVDRSNQKS